MQTVFGIPKLVEGTSVKGRLKINFRAVYQIFRRRSHLLQVSTHNINIIATNDHDFRRNNGHKLHERFCKCTAEEVDELPGCAVGSD